MPGPHPPKCYVIGAKWPPGTDSCNRSPELLTGSGVWKAGLRASFQEEDWQVQWLQVPGRPADPAHSRESQLPAPDAITSDFPPYWQTSSNPSRENKSRKLQNDSPLACFSSFHCNLCTISTPPDFRLDLHIQSRTGNKIPKILIKTKSSYINQ